MPIKTIIIYCQKFILRNLMTTVVVFQSEFNIIESENNRNVIPCNNNSFFNNTCNTNFIDVN